MSEMDLRVVVPNEFPMCLLHLIPGKCSIEIIIGSPGPRSSRDPQRCPPVGPRLPSLAAGAARRCAPRFPESIRACLRRRRLQPCLSPPPVREDILPLLFHFF